MVRTTDEMVQEILRRSERMKQKRNRGAVRALAAAAVILCFLMIGTVMWKVSGVPVGEKTSLYGAFLLSAEAGGYLLTAVAAFTAGVAVAMLLTRIRKKEGDSLRREQKGTGSDRSRAEHEE